MAMTNVYKVLFFLQSVGFICFLVTFYQNSNVVPAPAVVESVCRCQSNDTGRAYHQLVASCPSSTDTRGPLSNCTLADVLRRPGVVLLTTVNLGFLDMTLNMLESIKRIGVCVNTTVVAEDRKCYDYLLRRSAGDPAIHVMLTDTGQTQSAEISRGHRSEYYSFFSKRQKYVLDLLQQGTEVLFTDSDTFWFQDPFPYFRGDYDISMMDPRSPYPLRTPKSFYCAGFVYFKPTNVTIQFVKAWIQTMIRNNKIGKVLADQNVMNGLLLKDQPVHVNVQPLDWSIFPWGPKFYELLGENASYSAVVMHAASIRGRAAKVAKFKTSNMWLMNKTIDELIREK